MEVTQTLDHSAYNLAEAMEREKDAQFLERVRYNLLYYRALFIRRDMQKNQHFSPQILQTLSGLEIESVDAAEVNGIDIGVDNMRTVNKVPEVIRLNNRHAFFYVGSIDRLVNYSYIDPRQISYLQYDKYSQNKARYTYINGHIYLINVAPSRITVQAAFQDPTQLRTFSNEDGLPAYTEQSEFPIPMDMLQGITTGLLSGELKLVGDDKTNEININD